MSVQMAMMSEVGTRSHQEDYYVCRTCGTQVLAVVCDGMGGLHCGEVASQTAAVQLKEDFKGQHPISDIPAFFKKEIVALDSKVAGLRDGRNRLLHAGCTIVAVIFDEGRLYWMTAGDSEIFVIRGGEIAPVNKKHNYKLQLDEMAAYGRIDEKQYSQELSRGEQLLSYLGVGDIAVWDINDVPFQPQNGDYIALCTDGITGTIPPQELCRLVEAAGNPEEAVKAVRCRIRKKESGQDNATIVLMKYIEEKEEKGVEKL